MEVMTTQGDASRSASIAKMPVPTIGRLACHAPRRWFCGLLGAVISTCLTASLHAASPLASPLGLGNLTAVQPALSILPGQEAIYPLLGLFAAVVSTFILRRRRVAQMEAIAAADR